MRVVITVAVAFMRLLVCMRLDFIKLNAKGTIRDNEAADGQKSAVFRRPLRAVQPVNDLMRPGFHIFSGIGKNVCLLNGDNICRGRLERVAFHAGRQQEGNVCIRTGRKRAGKIIHWEQRSDDGYSIRIGRLACRIAAAGERRERKKEG